MNQTVPTRMLHAGPIPGNHHVQYSTTSEPALCFRHAMVRAISNGANIHTAITDQSFECPYCRAESARFYSGELTPEERKL
jgi:hypothetical protein